MKFLLVALFVVAGPGSSYAQQPAGIVLDPTGNGSKIYPVFDYSNWNIAPGSPYHTGADTHAQDWNHGCGDTKGKIVYAGISGRVAKAGSQSSYGNTVVIYDQRSSFALRYAHLDSIAVSQGDLVIAGTTQLGKVGNTGVSLPSGCPTDPGSHLHLVLYRNWTDPNNMPGASSGITYAAPFGYGVPVNLIKSSDPNDHAVYVYTWDGYKRPVTALAMETNGWSFSSAHNFVNSNYSPSWVNNLPYGTNQPTRNNVLFKGPVDSTVYIMEDGARRGVPGNVFSCRGLSFNDVRVLPFEGQQHDYEPFGTAPVLNSCFNDTQQAIKDMVERAGWQDWRFDTLPFLHQYSAPNMLYDPNWEWRQMLFRFDGGPHNGWVVWMAHITYRHDPRERYTEFWDPATGSNTGWIKCGTVGGPATCQ